MVRCSTCAVALRAVPVEFGIVNPHIPVFNRFCERLDNRCLPGFLG